MNAVEVVEARRQLDLSGAKIVQIDIRGDGKVIWVNVDGLCMLRVTGIEKLDVRNEWSQ